MFRSLIVGNRDTIAGTVYGTIIVLSVLTAGAPAFEHNEWKLEIIAGLTVLVFWLAHVYTHILGESIHEGHRLDREELNVIARRELAIPRAAVLPMIVIALSALGVIKTNTALWIAIGVGVTTLIIAGIRFARLERLSTIGTIASVSINLAFGLALVVLKSVLAH